MEGKVCWQCQWQAEIYSAGRPKTDIITTCVTYFVNPAVTDFVSLSLALHFLQVANHLSPVLKQLHANFTTRGIFSLSHVLVLDATLTKQDRKQKVHVKVTKKTPTYRTIVILFYTAGCQVDLLAVKI